MRFFVSLLSLVYLAIVFAFVGAVVGFFAGFTSVLLLGVDFASLPLFGAGGAAALSVWAFSRVLRGDAGAATFVEAAPRDGHWVASRFNDHARVVAEQTPPFDAVTFVDNSDAPNHVDHPRWMIDAFAFGDNLYEAVYEA
jgi:Zn-dependent protease with chaperone function